MRPPPRCRRPCRASCSRARAAARGGLSRCAQSVFVWQFGGDYLVGFQGEVGATPPALTSTATDLARTDGINYYGTESLTVDLGSGNDRFNVRGTTRRARALDRRGRRRRLRQRLGEPRLAAVGCLERDRRPRRAAVAAPLRDAHVDDLTFDGSLDGHHRRAHDRRGPGQQHARDQRSRRHGRAHRDLRRHLDPRSRAGPDHVRGDRRRPRGRGLLDDAVGFGPLRPRHRHLRRLGRQHVHRHRDVRERYDAGAVRRDADDALHRRGRRPRDGVRAGDRGSRSRDRRPGRRRHDRRVARARSRSCSSAATEPTRSPAAAATTSSSATPAASRISARAAQASTSSSAARRSPRTRSRRSRRTPTS